MRQDLIGPESLDVRRCGGFRRCIRAVTGLHVRGVHRVRVRGCRSRAVTVVLAWGQRRMASTRWPQLRCNTWTGGPSGPASPPRRIAMQHAKSPQGIGCRKRRR